MTHRRARVAPPPRRVAWALIGAAVLGGDAGTRADGGEPPSCPDPVPVWVDGRATAARCPAALAASGLTVLDLGDDYLPRILRAEPGTTIDYATTYQALAAERWAEVGPAAAADRYLELWGVTPTPSVVLARLADDARHACHDAVADDGLAAWVGALRQDLRTRARLRDAPERRAAIGAAQAHLACDGLLADDAIDRAYGHDTEAALAVFRRGQLSTGAGALDDELRALLTRDSRELDFAALLRVLRERVADAAGLLEDGSARAEWGTVLGRSLEPPSLHDRAGHPPLDHGAADLLSPATEAAARALGWIDPARARHGLTALRAAGTTRVAVVLPPAPAYHTPTMALRVEIDRGDVVTARPGQPTAARRVRRPVLTVLARDGAGAEVALARWPTTIGAWQRERLPGGAVRMRYKPSPTGEFVWRELVAAPVWYAPPTTPDRELIRHTDAGVVAREDTIGPGYRSAYGLVMLVHRTLDGDDDGVRSHGTVNFRSVQPGNGSHGCHRLLTPLAVRLTGFLLAHQPYTTRGVTSEPYLRVVRGGGKRFVIQRDDRGYVRELDPPVPVRVLRGRINPRAR